MNKPDLITDNDWKLLNKKFKKIEPIVKKIENKYPIQYLIGDVDFYGYKILVNKNVLIPRFETEELVEKTVNYLKKYHLEETSVLDIGTGSGCIDIVLKKNLKKLNITSIDISGKALKVAKRNAKLNNVDITFIKKSIFKYRPFNKYGLIISNPPYVDKSEEVGEEIKYEPQNAIFAKNNGLEFYQYIISNSKKYLQDKFIVAFEIGCTQGEYLKKIAKENFPKSIIKVEKDLSNRDRYLFIINK